MSFSLGCRSYISRGELHITVYAERESPNSSNTPGPFEGGLTGHRDRGDHDHNGSGGNSGGVHESAAQVIAQSYGSTYSSGQDTRATALKEKTVNAVSPAALQSFHETTQDYAKASQAFSQTVHQFTQSKQALQQTVTSFQATNEQFNTFLALNGDRLRSALLQKKLSQVSQAGQIQHIPNTWLIAEKQLVDDMIMNAHILSLPGRLIGRVLDHLISQLRFDVNSLDFPVLVRATQIIDETRDTLMHGMKELALTQGMKERLDAMEKELVAKWSKTYGYSPETTKKFIESVDIAALTYVPSAILGGVKIAAGGLAPRLKALKPQEVLLEKPAEAKVGTVETVVVSVKTMKTTPTKEMAAKTPANINQKVSVTSTSAPVTGQPPAEPSPLTSSGSVKVDMIFNGRPGHVLFNYEKNAERMNIHVVEIRVQEWNPLSKSWDWAPLGEGTKTSGFFPRALREIKNFTAQNQANHLTMQFTARYPRLGEVMAKRYEYLGLHPPLIKDYWLNRHNAGMTFPTFKIPFSEKAPIRFNPLSTPYDPQAFIQYTQRALNLRPPFETLRNGLQEIEEELLAYLPDVSHLAKEREGIWSALIAKQGTPMPPSLPSSVQYFRNLSDKYVAKISNGTQSFMVKDWKVAYEEELFREMMGTATMKSLELRHLKIPDLVAIGKYLDSHSHARTLLIKSFVPGETLEAFFVRGSLEEITQVALHAGKAMGELRSKGLKFREAAAIQPELDGIIRLAVDDLNWTNEALWNIGSSKRISEEAITLLRMFHPKFSETPGEITFCLADLHLKNFVFDKKISTLGYIDLDLVTIDVAKKPTGFAIQEYYECLSMFEKGGLLHGLSQQHIHAMKAAFNQGYFSEYSIPLPPASRSFFELKSSIEVIWELAQEAAAGKQINRDALHNLIDRLNVKIKLKDF